MDDAKMKRDAAVRRGVVVLIVLAVLTLIEFVVGVVLPVGWLLLLLGLAKAVVVVQYYMHLPRVFASGEGGH